MTDELNKNLQNDNAENNMAETNEEAVETVEEVTEGIEKLTEKFLEENEDEEDDSETTKKENQLVDDIIEIIESTLITVFVVIMMFTYLLHPVVVNGHSMNDTLFDTNRIFMTTLYTGPHYGDIIVIDNNKSYLLDENDNVKERDITNSYLKECLIKRVIAEPGQTITIDTDKEQVIVDGKILDEPYIKDSVVDAGDAFEFPITVPEGYYFVMGDNRRASADSRYADVGFIKKNQIYGKAICKYSPLKEFKFLLF
ncbi:signal peptidase I [Ruminococcus flavefaciens]|uniref:signal peptidase I n=1 Tax=Ruminococcus flavefaciens TaxID=1265 RepID=UPI0004BC3A67|nr:signal peptidase I [Ruminococcus flavefaciens]